MPICSNLIYGSFIIILVEILFYLKRGKLSGGIDFMQKKGDLLIFFFFWEKFETPPKKKIKKFIMGRGKILRAHFLAFFSFFLGPL